MISLTLYELNKAERMIASGEMSRKGIKKVKDEGMIRSEKQFMKGVDRGTARKLKGSGVKIRKSRLADLAGPVALRLPPEVNDQIRDSIPEMPKGLGNLVKKTATSHIKMPKGRGIPFRTMIGLKTGQHMSEKDMKKAGPLFRRHEADEQTVKRDSPSGIKFMNRKGKKEKAVGAHMSPEVLRREKKLTDFTTRAYGVGQGLANLRKETGEDKVASMSRRKARKVEKAADRHTDRAKDKLESSQSDMMAALADPTKSVSDKFRAIRTSRKKTKEIKPYEYEV